jgi:hypothetical protein
MSFTKGSPPGPHAGEMSPLTRALRPAVNLTDDDCQREPEDYAAAVTKLTISPTG